MRPDSHRAPLAQRGILHGSTHAPDHAELLDLLEQMQKTQIALGVYAVVAFILAAVALAVAL